MNHKVYITEFGGKLQKYLNYQHVYKFSGTKIIKQSSGLYEVHSVADNIIIYASSTIDDEHVIFGGDYDLLCKTNEGHYTLYSDRNYSEHQWFRLPNKIKQIITLEQF